MTPIPKNGPAAAAHPLISLPIRCKICGKQFPRPAGVDLAASASQRTASFVKVLVTHLGERHPQHHQAATLLGHEYAGMLHFQNFENLTGDLAEQREYLRAKVHAITRRAFVSDEKIDQRIRELLGRTMTTEEIEEAMREQGIGFRFGDLMRIMRDVLTEANTPYSFNENPYFVDPERT